ncbi:MAG: TrlF family AAA-like ATPase [Candidatus Scalindua sp.]
MAEQWNWAGARWWKFDFHTHTPKSEDYGKDPRQAELKERTSKEWLLDYMKTGIDCVAVTDHNSGEWIDELKNALKELESEKHLDYRTLYLFSGVEISVNGGIHILAILPEDKTASDINTLLGAVGLRGEKGKTNECTEKSPVEVIEEIIKAGGLAIPAHVDQKNGLFKEFQDKGTSLEQILESKLIIAMDICDSSVSKPALYTDKKLNWAEVLGSDAHHPTGEKSPGNHFTWVKMSTPSLEGVRLALLDGDIAIKRSDNFIGNPNEEHGRFIIEELSVEKAKYIGRNKPFKCQFNPWLNTIIGGRGTGKSTLLELLRLTLRREKELRALPESIQGDLRKYQEAYKTRNDDGLLTEDTTLIATYRKDDAVFRIQWNYSGEIAPIEEKLPDGTWREAPGNIVQRFPVRIYSQKQIFELAKRPKALLKIVDDAPQVEFREWQEHWNELQTKYLSLHAQRREIETGFEDEPRIKGELEDVRRNLLVFEKSKHTEVLKKYQQCRRQLGALKNWEESWKYSPDKIRELSEKILPDNIDESIFSNEQEKDIACLQDIRGTSEKIAEISRKLNSAAKEIDLIIEEWQKIKNDAGWAKSIDEAIEKYENLQTELADAGIEDPSEYGRLVQKRQSLEERLKTFELRKKSLAELKKQTDECLVKMLKHRRQLTEKRRKFLATLLDQNSFVSIDVIPYGDIESVEEDFRRLINREDRKSEKDIGSAGMGNGLLGDLYKNYLPDGKLSAAHTTEFEKKLKGLKKKIRSIYAGEEAAFDKRFVNHIKNIVPENLDRLDCWYPDDLLVVFYSVQQNGKKIPVQQGSPGQKTAALLAFLLTYGEEPLMLDQPEDDLDNHLIYDLIVAQLKAIKPNRQIIVVTHNANIVVNGDSENVLALEIKSGQTHKVCGGSLQESSVRDEICRVMEGGEKAFDLRYKRIREGASHVR